MQTTTYKLNISPGGIPLTIHISQYDVGLREFTFEPFTNVGSFSYVEGATVTLEATKPDGYAVIHACEYNNDGSITYTLQDQLAAVPGRVWSKVVIRNGNDVLGTGAILWVVDYAGVKDDAIISDSDISALQQWMDDVEDYAEQADGSAQAAASAVSLAESAVASAQEAATQAAGYVDQAVILGGTPLVAATVSAMTNHDRVYVYTGSETGYTAGNWYYWNGSAWTSGGIYNSSAVQTDPTLSVSGMAADAAATGELKSDLHTIFGTTVIDGWIEGKYYRTPSSVTNITFDTYETDATMACIYAECREGDIFLITGRGASGGKLWVWTKANGDIISRADSNVTAEQLELVAPKDSAYLLSSVYKADPHSLTFVSEKTQRVINTYGTVSEMIAATNLRRGNYVQTLGYTTPGDGMGAIYRLTDTDYVNTGYEPCVNGLYAIPLFPISTDNNKPIGTVDKMVEVAESFQGCGHAFTYSKDESTGTSYPTAIDSGFVENTYYIDCSALVYMLTNGVTFDNSRYSGASSNKRTYGAPFEYNPPFTGSSKIRSSYQMALYCAYHGLAYYPNSDYSNLRIGDLLFFANNDYSETDPERYMNIDHVCIYMGTCEENSSSKKLFQVLGNDGDSTHRSITTFFYYYFESEMSKVVLAAACPWQTMERINYGNLVENGDIPVVSESAALLNEYTLTHDLKSYTAYTIEIATDVILPALYMTLHNTDYKLYVNAKNLSNIKPTSKKLHIHLITADISGASEKNKLRVYSNSHSGTPYTIENFAIEEGWH